MRMKIRPQDFLIRHSAAVAVLALALASASAADWPQFLGPHRNAIADQTEPAITNSFPSSGPKVLWKKPLGTGFAGPVVAQGKSIVFHRVNDEATVEALNAKTGEAIWKFTYTTNYRDNFGFDNGPRACPTVADGKVIVHGAEGIVHALDLQSGKKLWSFDTVKELNSPQGYFGRACAPLVVDKKVIVTAGGRNDKGAAGVIALNLADGKPVWQSIEDEASYSSPVLFGDSLLICWLRNQLCVCDAKDGSVKFSTRLRSEMDASVNASVPIPCGVDNFFVSACYGVGGVMWKCNTIGKLTRVWQKEDALDCHYSTPVYADGYLFGFHGRQEQGQTLRCVRADDGKVMWESARVHGGTLLLAKDTLVALTESGELWLVDAKPDVFKQIATVQILRSGHRSYPALSNGVLYARDGTGMIALDLAH